MRLHSCTQPLEPVINSSQVLDLKARACQSAHKATVNLWSTAIGEEEAFASCIHSDVKIDAWEAAHVREEDAREKAKAAKKVRRSALQEILKSLGWSVSSLHGSRSRGITRAADVNPLVPASNPLDFAHASARTAVAFEMDPEFGWPLSFRGKPRKFDTPISADVAFSFVRRAYSSGREE